MNPVDKKPVCIVAGVGPGNGASIARAFANAGHAVALLARRAALADRLASELPDARAYACDVADAKMVSQVFARIREEMGPAEVLVYNAGQGVWGAIDKVSPEDFELAWRINTLGLFLTAREVIPAMRERGRGNIAVIGATASRRGVAGTAAFAPAKMAQRALAESMARYLGPDGIHVSLLIVDGIVATAQARARFPDRAEDAFIDPNAIAANVLQLTLQHRSAWSFEVDLRPYCEKW